MVHIDIASGVKPARDLRLDVLRGLALVMIFINHTPGTVFENFTSRNFGFSDAAEGFVFMSGISAALAYGKFFVMPKTFIIGVGRMWRRAWTLYQVHIVTTMAALAVAAACAHWFGGAAMMQTNALDAFGRDPLAFLIAIPLLTHQLGYANILPLYALLLFVGPFLLWWGLRFPWVLVAVSFAVWAICAQYYINMPSYPNIGGWFLNPLCWQVLFVLGLLTGLRLKTGKRLVPVRRDLLVVAIIWLLLAGFMAFTQVHWPQTAPFYGHLFWYAQESLHTPWFVMEFNKSYLTGVRLTHALALIYVLSCWPRLHVLCNSFYAVPLALLGRNGLLVFGVGVVLCYFANAVKLVTNGGFVPDMGLIFGGLSIMFGAAVIKEKWARAERRAMGA